MSPTSRQCGRALERQARWGSKLDGVIHLAGIPHDRQLLEETPESFAEALRRKVLGTWVLHQLVKDRPGSLFLAFSSVNSFFGSARAGAYAAANRFVEHFAHYQRHQGRLRSYCFAWSQWDEVGMSRQNALKEVARAHGYQAIAADQGLNALRVALHHNQADLLVGLDGAHPHLRRHVETGTVQARQMVAYYTAPG